MGSRNQERSQVGIGTLIVFIAMVLVAAIAAGVLIDTASLLQSQSENVGEESQSLVTNNLQIISQVGITNGEKIENKLYFNGFINDAIPMTAPGSYELVEEHTVNNSKVTVTLDIINGDGTTKLKFNGELTDKVYSPGDKITFTKVNRTHMKIEDGGGTHIITTSVPVHLSAQVPDTENETAESVTEYVIFYFPDTYDAISFSYGTEPDQSYTTFPTKPDRHVEAVNVTVKRAPGSDTIDLSDLVVIYRSDRVQQTLTYDDSISNRSYYRATTIRDSDTLLEKGLEQGIISLNTTYLEPGQGGLENGESATIEIITQSGGKTSTEVQVPPVLSGKPAVPL